MPIQSGHEKKTIPLFAGLTKSVLADVLQLSERKHFTPGALIAAPDTIPTTLISVVGGSVQKRYAAADTHYAFETLVTGDSWAYQNLIAPGKKYPYGLYAGDDGALIAQIRLFALRKRLERARDREIIMHAILQLTDQALSHHEKNSLFVTTLANLVSESKNPDIDAILSLLLTMCHGQSVLIARFDNTNQRITIEYSAGYRHDLIGTILSVAADTVLSLTLSRMVPTIIDHNTFERKFALAKYAKPSMLLAPILNSGRTIGAILLGHTKKSAFSVQDADRLSIARSLLAPLLMQSETKKIRDHAELLKRTYIG